MLTSFFLLSVLSYFIPYFFCIGLLSAIINLSSSCSSLSNIGLNKKTFFLLILTFSLLTGLPPSPLFFIKLKFLLFIHYNSSFFFTIFCLFILLSLWLFLGFFFIKSFFNSYFSLDEITTSNNKLSFNSTAKLSLYLITYFLLVLLFYLFIFFDFTFFF